MSGLVIVAVCQERNLSLQMSLFYHNFERLLTKKLSPKSKNLKMSSTMLRTKIDFLDENCPSFSISRVCPFVSFSGAWQCRDLRANVLQRTT